MGWVWICEPRIGWDSFDVIGEEGIIDIGSTLQIRGCRFCGEEWVLEIDSGRGCLRGRGVDSGMREEGEGWEGWVGVGMLGFFELW